MNNKNFDSLLDHVYPVELQIKETIESKTYA